MSTKNQTVANSTIPLPVPANPEKWICVQMIIPDNLGHRAAFLGAISNLATWRVWQRDIGHNATVVAQLWQIARRSIRFVSCETPVIFPNFGEDDENMPALYEPYCREDGTCGFHYRCDICGDWHDVADASAVNSPNSPSDGTPQPPPNGGTISVCKKLLANSTLLLDAPVSTGDVVTIISASGSGNDGGEIQWRCPDGGTYVAGLCDDPAVSFPGGDPVNSSPHMSLILMVSGVAYPFYPAPSPYTLVPITIPGGISNSYAELQVNDSALGNNKGDYSICYEQKNNQAGVWTKTWDFTINQGPWFCDNSTEGGHWQAGVGFVSDQAQPTDGDQLVIFFAAVPAATYQGWSAVVVCTSNTNQTESALVTNGVNDAVTVNPGTQIVTAAHVPLTGQQLVIAFANRPSAAVGEYVVTSATLHGTGVSPF
jgi:hypothetical protein